MEIWKDIKGYEGLYQVSNLGNVKSLNRNKIYKDTFIKINERLLKPSTNKGGYKQVVLYKNDSKKTFKVHRLVALVFLDNSNQYLEVNHKNGIKHDNYVNNLEWCNHSQNVQHSFDNKLQIPLCGEKHGMSKLNKEDILNIKQSLLSSRKIAKNYNVNKSTILRIRNNQIWKHL